MGLQQTPSWTHTLLFTYLSNTHDVTSYHRETTLSVSGFEICDILAYIQHILVLLFYLCIYYLIYFHLLSITQTV